MISDSIISPCALKNKADFKLPLSIILLIVTIISKTLGSSSYDSLNELSNRLRELTGGADVRLIWIKCDGKEINPYKKEFVGTIWFYNSKECLKLQVCPNGDCTPRHYYRPLFTSDGKKIIYTLLPEKEIHLLEIEKKSSRIVGKGIALCVRKIGGIEWVYLKGKSLIKRINIEEPTAIEDVFINSEVIDSLLESYFEKIQCFEVSGDGKQAVLLLKRGLCAKIVLPNCRLDNTKQGTWVSIAPDSSYRWLVFNNLKSTVQLYDNSKRHSTHIYFEHEALKPKFVDYFTKWSSNSAKFVVSVSDLIDNKSNVYIGRFNDDFKSIKEWVCVTNNESAMCFPDAFIEDVNALQSISMPTITASSSQFEDSSIVTISHTYPGSQIFYTLDGSEPNETSFRYSKPLTIRNSCTIKAIEYRDKKAASGIAQLSLFCLRSKKPIIWPGEGVYKDSVIVFIKAESEKQQIYYTLDGTEPNRHSIKYTSDSITIKRNTLLKAIAIEESVMPSRVAVSYFTIVSDSGSLHLISPNGGEVIKVGQTFSIKWSYGGKVASVPVIVHLSVDSGKNWIRLDNSQITSTDKKLGIYKWNVPAFIYSKAEAKEIPIATTKAIVKIHSILTDSVADVSDSCFSIIDNSDKEIARLQLLPQHTSKTESFAIKITPEQNIVVGVHVEEEFTVEITSANGTTISNYKGRGPTEYIFSDFPTGGVYIVRARSGKRKQAKIVVINK